MGANNNIKQNKNQTQTAPTPRVELENSDTYSPNEWKILCVLEIEMVYYYDSFERMLLKIVVSQ